jgi:hypothetical protein
VAKLTAALVLVDVTSHGLKAGNIVEADAGLIKALQADGSVDPHKDAVAYAKSQEAAVVRVGAEAAPDVPDQATPDQA